MKRLFAVACVLFMIGTVPMGLFAGAGTDGSGPQGEDGTFTQKAGEDGPEGFTFDTWAVTDEDIEVLKDQCGLFDPTSDRVALVDGYGTGMVPPPSTMA